jgi:homoserine O-acetyltransferase
MDSGKASQARIAARPGRSVRHSPAVVLGLDRPLRLAGGAELAPFTVAYQTYGTLNEERSNTILVCHALTGDQYLAGIHPLTGRRGWWDDVVGPGRPLDTERFHIVCVNVLGACMGTTGPSSLNPATGRPYNLDFPLITVGDMVEAQAMLLDHLGIDRLLAVVGGSMGGMQVLEWARRYPERVFSAMPIACAARHTAQNIAFHEVGRQAIMADPNWHGGDYAAHGTRPSQGLAVARMAAHITYLSDESLHRKFGRGLQDREEITFAFEPDFKVESYLHYQGRSFVERFDANSYLYITRAMDYFDIAAEHGGSLHAAFADTPVRFCLISFTSDWLFPTSEVRSVVHALNANAANVSFVEIETDKGHDSFLLDVPEFTAILRGFLDSAAEQRDLGAG